MIDDRYELVRQIGRGGTAAVWLGQDTVLGRRVAMKRLGFAPDSTESDAARAEREAHLAARVHHPNVVAVYDLVDDDADGHTWLVMEHVDGPTLAELCHRSPLDPERTAHLLAQVAEGLAAAHALDIVHRDVKPSNILVTDEDVAKLGDFGIARRENDEALTRTGLITGSPAYLAPEVARGQTATTASDVWALGATLYHVSTGEPPFSVGDDIIAAVQSIIDDTAPTLPTTHPLADVVAATMRREPSERPTMADVAAQLREISPLPFAVLAGPLTVPVVGSRADGALLPDDAPAAGADADHTAVVDHSAGTHERTRSWSVPRAEQPAAVYPSASPTTPSADDGPDLPAPTGRPRRRTAVLAAAAAVSLLAGLGTAVVLEQRNGPDAPASASVSDAPVASRLESFATEYLEKANNDPEQGFSMLTPDYQAKSGGLSGYEGFWGNVSDVKVQRISADAERLRVTYIYSYTYQGTPHRETVTLYLEQKGDGFLISGADSI